MASVRSSSDIDLSSIADGGEEEPLGDLNDEELFDLVQKTVYVFLVLFRGFFKLDFRGIWNVCFGSPLIENLVDLFSWTDYPEYGKFTFPGMFPKLDCFVKVRFNLVLNDTF